ncbi:MAG: nucleotidyl transferase AbiEii/AbiGii toxin family protein [Gemmataceae bacterium]|nr:nucleotidyl transferase AbiEii/AbiGii toxin family protein [Gemmataceae bacterium]
MARQFGSASAFKASLEAHLRKRAEERAVPFTTLQLKFVIERLLARLFRGANPPWLLKGGFAMDLRFRPGARTTKDVDLSVALATAGSRTGSLATLREKLQEAADVDLGDYLTYRIGTPKRERTNAPNGGGRYACEALLVGKTYAKFHIDIGIGDALIGEPDPLTGDDILSFAGIEPLAVLAIPKPQQFAEKVHAYTFPWEGRLNTRTKDLVDLVLLLERGPLDAEGIRQALAATFKTRGTHAMPEKLPQPPDFWAADFAGMADEAKLSTRDYLTAFGELARFWDANALGAAG